MACNCKKKMELEEKYGTLVGENILEKISRLSFKVLFAIIAMCLVVVVVPITLVVAFYKMIFGNGKIILPNFMGKYLVNTNG